MPRPSPSVSPSDDPKASALGQLLAVGLRQPHADARAAYAELDRSGAQPLPCGEKTKAAAEQALAAISVSKHDTQYCVISSADQNLGCFIDQTSAEEQQRATGQQRLLDVIGQTARLEERPVISAIGPGDPAFATTPVTCGTEAERQEPKCAPDALVSQEVVYLDEAGNKYRLAPAVISGGDIANATAILGGGTQSQVVTQWEVQFELTGDATKKFADATTAAVSLPPPQNQIAIVVDQVIISSPTVQSPITTGTGVITGGFSETEAKDLATVLNAGALPVELTRQSVQTVSPTLGSESLRQGIVAGVVGLILLFLYLLFYYRLLGVVAWVGMSIWAILALALVSLAGIQFGYALTLAGVAGLVISLGVTADSYIVFFERLKDEVRSGKIAAIGGAAGVRTRVQDDRGCRHRHRDRGRRAVHHGREFGPRVRAHPRGGDRAGPVRRVVLQATHRVPDRAQRDARAPARVRAHQRCRRRGRPPSRAGSRRNLPGVMPRELPSRDGDLSWSHDPALPLHRTPEHLVRYLGCVDRAVAGGSDLGRPELLDRLRRRGADQLRAQLRRHDRADHGDDGRRRQTRCRGADRQRRPGVDPDGEPRGGG